MKIRTFIMALLATIAMCAKAYNEMKSVKQVTDLVSLTDNVDFVITDATPFATAGSVNFINTEHAVLIIEKVKPSKVISNWLPHVFINGEKAVNGDNCQVRMYNNGAIVYPYAQSDAPLTCYTEANYEGESCSDYTEGHVGGFMKTLTDKNLNNKISSFKLKRGYMVTFAIGTSGWGYSRCFIADDEDLEMATLPSILNNKISSYRIFKWNSVNKRGVADCLNATVLNACGAYSSYTWGKGFDMSPDYECIVHHIYENYPSPASLGSQDYACHMKTNNEPMNPADDPKEKTESIEQVLANWQDLMRTGLRLCSPSSWDGSDYWNGTGYIKSFLDEIDARGWRCDIVDAHCYWPSGNFAHLEGKWWPNMHRPIWISEWVWGASWNNNGAFANGVTEAQNAEALKGILNTLKNSPHVERYFYWNGERDPSKIYKNGSLTAAGKVYAEIDPGIGYDKAYQFIPKDTRIEDITGFTCDYNRINGDVQVTWTDPNCELSEVINVQRKLQGEFLYTTIATMNTKDKTSNAGAFYKYTDNLQEPGTYIYRVQVKTYNNKTLNTDEAIVSVAPAQGTDKVQYGNLTIGDTKSTTTYFSNTFETRPCVFMGSVTNVNSKFNAANITAKTSSAASFTYQFLPWQTSTDKEPAKAEEIPFVAMMEGNYNFGKMDCEVGLIKSEKATGTDTWTDVTEVTFKKPFPEGVTPVVMTELRNPSYSSTAPATSLSVRIFDVTNTGFKFIIYSEDASGRKIALPQNVCYMAVTPGFEMMDADNGIMIAAGFGTDSQIFGSISYENSFRAATDEGEDAESSQLKFHSPTILTSLQTNNYPVAAILRRTNVTTTDDDGKKWVTGVKIKRNLDHAIKIDGQEISTTSSSNAYAAYRDNLGWIVIAHNTEGSSVPTDIHHVNYTNSSDQLKVRIADGHIIVEGVENYRIYNAAGVQIPTSASLPAGIYMVVSDGQQVKVQIK